MCCRQDTWLEAIGACMPVAQWHTSSEDSTRLDPGTLGCRGACTSAGSWHWHMCFLSTFAADTQRHGPPGSAHRADESGLRCRKRGDVAHWGDQSADTAAQPAAGASFQVQQCTADTGVGTSLPDQPAYHRLVTDAAARLHAHILRMFAIVFWPVVLDILQLLLLQAAGTGMRTAAG